MGEKKEAIWNVPNGLTMLRMALLPVYWLLFLHKRRYWALAVFVMASLTDLLDGHIARKRNLITNFGKLMDPLADKLMVLSVMLSLTQAGLVPLAVLLVLLGKEFVMLCGGALLLKRKIVVASVPVGKAAQATVVASLLLSFFGDWFDGLGFPLHRILLWCAVGLTLAALAYYSTNAVRLWNEAGREQNAQ